MLPMKLRLDSSHNDAQSLASSGCRPVGSDCRDMTTATRMMIHLLVLHGVVAARCSDPEPNLLLLPFSRCEK